MSKKQETVSALETNEPEKILDRVVINLQSQSDCGKSTVADGMVQIADSLGIQTAKYATDNTGLLFANLHGQRGANGKLLEDQDPILGVKRFNPVNKSDREKFINLVVDPSNLKIIDTRSAIVDLIRAVMGDLPSLISSYTSNDVLPVFPISVKDAKSLETVEIIYHEIMNVTEPYQILLIKNTGLIDSEPDDPAVVDFNQLYENSPGVKFFRTRKNTREIVFGPETHLTTKGAAVIKEYKLSEIVTWPKTDPRALPYDKQKLNILYAAWKKQLTPFLLETYEDAYNI